MIKKDYDNRLFDTDIAPTYGEFVRKIGGYREYYKWAFNNPLPKQQGRNELCNCGSGKKYKKCCM